MSIAPLSAQDNMRRQGCDQTDRLTTGTGRSAARAEPDRAYPDRPPADDGRSAGHGFFKDSLTN